MQRYWLIWMVLLTLSLPVCLAQGNDAPLGDVARALRREKEEKDKKDHPVIDNENLDQLMNEMQSKKFNTLSLLFSLDAGSSKSFKVSAPDVSCNLAFNGKTTSLLTDGATPRSIPIEEISKLDGPAVIQGNTLHVSFFNGSAWNIKELIVGLTTLRTPSPTSYGPMLKPASESVVELTQKHPDQTVIYHLRGTAAPQTTTVFTADLTNDPGSEWHWAIVAAKGIPADTPDAAVPATLPAAPTAEPALATSTGNPRQ